MASSKLKLKIKGSTKKQSKTNSSSKSQKTSSTRAITSRFCPDERYHLVIEEQGEIQVYSFSEIGALQREGNKRILDARKSDIPLRLWCFHGMRCPISAGPIPRTLIDDTWVPLVDDFSATVAQCPVDGLIVGESGPAEGDEDVGHLDTDLAPEDAEDEVIVDGVVSEGGEDPEKVLQIFNQPSKAG